MRSFRSRFGRCRGQSLLSCLRPVLLQGCSPLHHEGAVGRGALHAGEDATPTREGAAARFVIGKQVVPVREDDVAIVLVGQATVSPGRAVSGELQSTV